MTRFDLEGRVAIVTGGNGGIGLGAALAMAEAGATVVLAARNAAKAEDALTRLHAVRDDARFVQVDVTRQADCRRLVEEVVAAFGHVDVLVNNAGMSVRKPPQELTPEEWHAVLDTNLSGALYCAQAAFEPMRRQGRGKIINVGSMMSLFGAWYAAAYASSKGGLVQLTKALAVAWAPDNIQVNAVLPGWVDTELTIAARKTVPELHDRVVARTPAARWGTPDDLAGPIVFLASVASDFVTGATLAVDGGFSAQG